MVDIIRYFLLSRPYSWISIVFVSILASVFSNGLVSEWIYVDILFTLSVWLFCNFFAEAFSNDVVERGKISLIIPSILLIISLSIILIRSIVALPFFIIIILSLVIYSGKSKGNVFGAISFLVRGMMELNLFIIVLLFNSFDFSGSLWLVLGLVVYSITVGRNLIGDIRDFEFDKFTFPKLVGKDFARIVSILFYVVSIFLFSNIFFSLLFAIILLIFFKDYFYLHRFLIIINSFALFEICIYLIAPEVILLVDLMLLGVLLNFTYLQVPRNSKPKFFL